MLTKTEIIDAWYEEKKAKLFEEYRKALESNDKSAEKTYKEKSAALRKKYDSKVESALISEKKSVLKFMKDRANPTPKLIPTIEQKWNKIVRLFSEK